MKKTISADEILPIEIILRKGQSEVWLRKNIELVESESTEDMESYQYWTADETSGILPYTISFSEVEENFDELWESFNLKKMTDRQLAEKTLELTQMVQAQIDFTALMTDTVIEMEE